MTIVSVETPAQRPNFCDVSPAGFLEKPTQGLGSCDIRAVDSVEMPAQRFSFCDHGVKSTVIPRDEGLIRRHERYMYPRQRRGVVSSMGGYHGDPRDEGLIRRHRAQHLRVRSRRRGVISSTPGSGREIPATRAGFVDMMSAREGALFLRPEQQRVAILLVYVKMPAKRRRIFDARKLWTVKSAAKKPVDSGSAAPAIPRSPIAGYAITRSGFPTVDAVT